jgi:hypothetical protein
MISPVCRRFLGCPAGPDTWQVGEALRLAHENELAPIDPKVVIRAAKAEITETHVKAAEVVGGKEASVSHRKIAEGSELLTPR